MKTIRVYNTSYIPCHFKDGGGLNGIVHKLYNDFEINDEQYKKLITSEIKPVHYCCSCCTGHNPDWDIINENSSKEASEKKVIGEVI